ncbi:YitT family protein [Absiella sp. AM54-8XD]|uniref:YitT family protein n=1 Tax=Absiella sp. AM54-8XD TaxID=2292279 RepID=UPI002102194D|nr:YitT family protein [Absiella sp. AM54-8XD]
MKHKKKETKVQKIITNYGMMLAGALIFALACNCFIVPSSLNNSGVIGFSQIVREAWIDSPLSICRYLLLVS